MVDRRARAIEALTKDSDPVANLLLEFLIADLEAEPAALRLLVAELESQVALTADAHENAHSENRGEIVRLCHELDAANLEVMKLSETVASEGAEVLRLLNECSELLQERDEARRAERELREKFSEAIAEIQRLTGELEAASDQRTVVKLPEENVFHVSGTGEAAATPDEADQAEQELVEALGSAVVVIEPPIVLEEKRPPTPPPVVRQVQIVQPWKASYSPEDLLQALEMYSAVEFPAKLDTHVAKTCNMSFSQARSVRINYRREIDALAVATDEQKEPMRKHLSGLFAARVRAAKEGGRG